MKDRKGKTLKLSDIIRNRGNKLFRKPHCAGLCNERYSRQSAHRLLNRNHHWPRYANGGTGKQNGRTDSAIAVVKMNYGKKVVINQWILYAFL